MTERRDRRRNVRQAMVLINTITGGNLGRIGNLSAGGLMLISPHAVGESNIYQAQFQLLDAGSATRKIDLAFQVLWCAPAGSKNTFWSGCQTIDISERDRAAIHAWANAED